MVPFLLLLSTTGYESQRQDDNKKQKQQQTDIVLEQLTTPNLGQMVLPLLLLLVNYSLRVTKTG